jgi:ubiquitin-protein ligase
MFMSHLNVGLRNSSSAGEGCYIVHLKLRCFNVMLSNSDIWCRWIIEVHGAPGTLYEGETFHLQVDFPEHYPMEAPVVRITHV